MTTKPKPMLIYHRGRHGEYIGIKENSLAAFELAIQEGAPMIEFDVRAGLRIAHDCEKADTAPTLVEVLELIHGRCAVNIEIKSPWAAVMVKEILLRYLRVKAFQPEQIVISSFHHRTAIDMKLWLPQLRVGIINDGVFDKCYVDWLAQQGINQLHLHWTNLYMDKENGYEIRDAMLVNKMNLWVWTVNSQSVFKTVADYGVEAVFTDQPDLFR